jgi:hypothetical protein
MEWETIVALVFLIIFFVFVILQSIRVYLWKDKYMTLVKSLKLGETDGQTEESNTSRGNTEEND